MKLLKVFFVSLFLFISAEESVFTPEQVQQIAEITNNQSKYSEGQTGTIDLSELLSPEALKAHEEFIMYIKNSQEYGLDEQHVKDIAWIEKHLSRFSFTRSLLVSLISAGIISIPLVLKYKMAPWIIGSIVAGTLVDTLFDIQKSRLHEKAKEQAVLRLIQKAVQEGNTIGYN